MEELAWFLDGLAERQLLLHRCTSCGAFSEPRALACYSCGSPSLEPTPASGRAVAVSWTRTHARPPADGGSAEASTFVIAELEEGPWWWGELLADGAGRDLEGEAPLLLDFRAGADGRLRPVFRRA